QRPFGYFWLRRHSGRLPKVTRCKSGTISRRYRSNGYVHSPPQPNFDQNIDPERYPRPQSQLKDPPYQLTPPAQVTATSSVKPRTAV
ncbi:hypothetical protein, partial [Pseudomonas sp. PAMC 26793]|uniref:hypothetical protein n=1 Tax=Pseudomonas sp. PAMC 26793 TaxID=1240676 RepID=UPI001C4511B2